MEQPTRSSPPSEDWLRGLADLPFAGRVEALCRRFLGTPLVRDPYGEGEAGRFDRQPALRFDAFNCISYVETVIALAFGLGARTAESILRRIRYRGPRIAFEDRCHWIAGEWAPHNFTSGLLSSPLPADSDSDWPRLSYIIAWDKFYEDIPLSRVHRPDLTDPERAALWGELRGLGRARGALVVDQPYIPFDRLFCATREAAGEGAAPLGEDFLNVGLVGALPEVAVVVFLGRTAEHLAIAFPRGGSGTIYHAADGRPPRVYEQDLIGALAFRHRFTSHPGIRVFALNPDWDGAAGRGQ